MIITRRYFLCKETFTYNLKKDELPTYYGSYGNAFTASISWSTSYSTYSSYANNENGIREFTGGRIYPVSWYCENNISFYDNYGNIFDVTSHQYEDKFIEIFLNFTEKEEKLLEDIKTRGYEVSITPIQALYDNETNTVNTIIHSISVSDRKIREGWLPLGTTWVETDNISSGIFKGVRNLMRKAEAPSILKDCLKGKYSVYLGLKRSIMKKSPFL